jgi:hypothetical protein
MLVQNQTLFCNSVLATPLVDNCGLQVVVPLLLMSALDVLSNTEKVSHKNSRFYYISFWT